MNKTKKRNKIEKVLLMMNITKMERENAKIWKIYDDFH